MTPTSSILTARDIGSLLWWRPIDVARAWGVSEDAVIDAIDAGTLAARPAASGWRVHRDDVEKGEA